MPKVSFTLLELQELMENSPHHKFTEAERKAAIKTLRGSVNRAYQRSLQQYGLTPATERMQKGGGEIRTWTDIKDWSYKDQMKEIRRGVKMSKMKTLTPSGYYKTVQHVADMVNSDKTPDYNDLTEDEKRDFWYIMKILRKNSNFMKTVYNRIGSDEAIRMVYTLTLAKQVTVDDILARAEDALMQPAYRKATTDKEIKKAVKRFMNNTKPDYAVTRHAGHRGSVKNAKPNDRTHVTDPAHPSRKKSTNYKDTRKKPTKQSGKPKKDKGMPTTEL